MLTASAGAPSVADATLALKTPASKPAAKPKAQAPRGSQEARGFPAAAKTGGTCGSADRDGDPCPRRPTIPMSIWCSAPYQRGQYKTALELATKTRAGDRRSQGDDDAGRALRQCDGCQNATYAHGGRMVTRRAADGRATARACFALAMMRLGGGAAAPVNREEAVKLLASSAKLGNPKAALQSGAALSRRPDAAAGPQGARRSCFASPPTPAIRKAQYAPRDFL